MIHEQRLHDLIEAFYRGSLTKEEEEELNIWFNSSVQDDLPYPDEEVLVRSRMFVRLMEDSGYVAKKNRIRLLRKWYAVAASIALLLTGGLAYYISGRMDIPDNRIIVAGKTDIRSGRSTAQLILEDGSVLDLDTAIGAIKIDGDVQYADGSPIKSSRLQQENILVSSRILKVKTPRAGQYRIQLSDGTVVWMNAATELTYPKEFPTDKREVMLDGEAYFEVAHDTRKPFIVKGEKQTVEVLGTKFNMANYSSRTTARTTLLSGSVNIHTRQGDRLLRPGQEVSSSERGTTVRDVYAEDAIAWKNGRFLFDNERLENVMEKISDWYDVQIEFKDTRLKAEKIFATVGRYENISVVLSKIEATGVASFVIEQDRIQVLPFRKK